MHSRSRIRTVLAFAVPVAGLGMALVGLDGAPWWAAIRVSIFAVVTACVMAVVRRGPSLPTALVAFAFGLVATAAGGAIVVSYVGSGAALRVGGGLLAAVGGLVTLGSALVLGIRAVRGWRRPVLPALALVLVYVAGFPITISVYATNVGRPRLGRETPADLGLRYVDASFPTADGVTLTGWYIPSVNHAAVVLLHGASSTRSAVLDQAAVVARHGYGVLLFDARGMGRSGGRAMNLGWYGDRDVRAAVDYLAARPEIDPARIAAVGESMGGEEAIGALADDTRLRTVVAEGATNRVVADWKWLPDRYGVRGLGQLGVQWLTSSLTDLLTDASPPVSLRSAVARAAPRRVLLIAAGRVSDEISADRYIEAGSPDTVEVWVVAGAGHTGGLRAQPDAWERRVVGFLDRSLGVRTNASTP